MSSELTDLVASPSTQLALDLPAPAATAETPLPPARMVHEYVYRPRSRSSNVTQVPRCTSLFAHQ